MKHKKLSFKKRARLETKSNLISEQSPFSLLESYKAARTNLMFSVTKENCPVFLFTSAIPGEGKTTTCMNVAITFAQAGFKTLLIDADMRRPRIYKNFAVSPSPGLSDILVGFSDIGCICETNYKNLFLIPSGTIPPNPAELMTSQNMKALLDQLKEQYDYIFVDSPPVTVVTDAVVLANHVSGVIVVTRQGYSRKDTVSECVLALEQVKANVLGTILNACENKARGGYYGGYKRYEDYVGVSLET